jgi:hypothetical protein
MTTYVQAKNGTTRNAFVLLLLFGAVLKFQALLALFWVPGTTILFLAPPPSSRGFRADAPYHHR